MVRVTAVARGRVQGVGYRYFVTYCARETGVSGFVRNMADGSVLIIAEGNDDVMETFLYRVQATGEFFIRVDSLATKRGDPTGEFAGFGIRR
jgi:acylphosphatase